MSATSSDACNLFSAGTDNTSTHWWDGIVKLADSLVQGFLSLIGAVFDAICGLLGGIVNFVMGLWNNIVGPILGAANELVKSIVSITVNTLVDTLWSVFVTPLLPSGTVDTSMPQEFSNLVSDNTFTQMNEASTSLFNTDSSSVNLQSASAQSNSITDLGGSLGFLDVLDYIGGTALIEMAINLLIGRILTNLLDAIGTSGDPSAESSYIYSQENVSSTSNTIQNSSSGFTTLSYSGGQSSGFLAISPTLGTSTTSTGLVDYLQNADLILSAGAMTIWNVWKKDPVNNFIKSLTIITLTTIKMKAFQIMLLASKHMLNEIQQNPFVIFSPAGLIDLNNAFQYGLSISTTPTTFKEKALYDISLISSCQIINGFISYMLDSSLKDSSWAFAFLSVRTVLAIDAFAAFADYAWETFQEKGQSLFDFKNIYTSTIDIVV